MKAQLQIRQFRLTLFQNQFVDLLCPPQLLNQRGRPVRAHRPLSKALGVVKCELEVVDYLVLFLDDDPYFLEVGSLLRELHRVGRSEACQLFGLGVPRVQRLSYFPLKSDQRTNLVLTRRLQPTLRQCPPQLADLVAYFRELGLQLSEKGRFVLLSALVGSLDLLCQFAHLRVHVSQLSFVLGALVRELCPQRTLHVLPLLPAQGHLVFQLNNLQTF